MKTTRKQLRRLINETLTNEGVWDWWTLKGVSNYV